MGIGPWLVLQNVFVHQPFFFQRKDSGFQSAYLIFIHRWHLIFRFVIRDRYPQLIPELPSAFIPSRFVFCFVIGIVPYHECFP